MYKITRSRNEPSFQVEGSAMEVNLPWDPSNATLSFPNFLPGKWKSKLVKVSMPAIIILKTSVRAYAHMSKNYNIRNESEE